MNHAASLHLRHLIVLLVSTSASGEDDVTTLKEKSGSLDNIFFGNIFKNLADYTTSQNKLSHLVVKKKIG
jgi:hypothetical protein